MRPSGLFFCLWLGRSGVRNMPRALRLAFAPGMRCNRRRGLLGRQRPDQMWVAAGVCVLVVDLSPKRGSMPPCSLRHFAAQCTQRLCQLLGPSRANVTNSSRALGKNLRKVSSNSWPFKPMTRSPLRSLSTL